MVNSLAGDKILKDTFNQHGSPVNQYQNGWTIGKILPLEFMYIDTHIDMPYLL